MRYFSSPDQKKAVAQAVACCEKEFELGLLWPDMQILVQGGDQDTIERVVRLNMYYLLLQISAGLLKF